MSREEIIARIKKNKNPKYQAITLIADFLVINKREAEKIYEEEFGNVQSGSKFRRT